MPIYTYECPHCKARYEKFCNTVDADKPPVCPRCREKTKKVPSVPAKPIVK